MRGYFTQKHDQLVPVYAHIDFERAVVAGSYALNQFTGDPRWSPNDVDIVTTAHSIDHFRHTVDSFCAGIPGAQVTKFNDFAQGHPGRTADEDRRDEKFHEAIKASAKVSVPGIDIPLQFVWIQGLSPDLPVERQLEQIADCPSCVCYKVSYGRRFFIVPEKGRQALFTRRVPASDICPARRAKYEERMYEFY